MSHSSIKLPLTENKVTFEVEQMAFAIHLVYPHDCTDSDLCREIAQRLWDAGYRHQTEQPSRLSEREIGVLEAAERGDDTVTLSRSFARRILDAIRSAEQPKGSPDDLGYELAQLACHVLNVDKGEHFVRLRDEFRKWLKEPPHDAVQPLSEEQLSGYKARALAAEREVAFLRDELIAGIQRAQQPRDDSDSNAHLCGSCKHWYSGVACPDCLPDETEQAQGLTKGEIAALDYCIARANLDPHTLAVERVKVAQNAIARLMGRE